MFGIPSKFKAWPRQKAVHEHLPAVEDGEMIFLGREHTPYYVGLVALCGDELMPSAYLAARQLRFEKYNRLGWLDEAARAEDGGEHKGGDGDRSAEFAVLSNDEDCVRVIATARLILGDQSPDEPLPVEHHFPNVRATPSDTEISRLVSDSRNKVERSLATFACQRAILGWGVANGYKSAYAMTEEWLLDRLDDSRIPYEQRAEYKNIAEYSDTRNTVIQLYPDAVLKSTRLSSLRTPLSTTLFFHSAKTGQGLGHYGRNFIWRYGP